MGVVSIDRCKIGAPENTRLPRSGRSAYTFRCSGRWRPGGYSRRSSAGRSGLPVAAVDEASSRVLRSPPAPTDLLVAGLVAERVIHGLRAVEIERRDAEHRP